MRGIERQSRERRWDAAFDPNRLALYGVAFSTALMFQTSVYARLGMFAAAAGAVWLSGRRFSAVMSAVVMSGIIVASVCIPAGKKIYALGPIVVTDAALLGGIEKALTFETLIFISKATLSPRIKFPGRFGIFLAECLRFYKRILEQKFSYKRENFFSNIDKILISVYYTNNIEQSFVQAEQKYSAFKWTDIACIIIIGVCFRFIFWG